MKILHVSTPLTWRGGEQQIAFLAEELKLNFINQLVLCPAGSKLQQWCDSNNIPCVTFKKRGSLDFLLARKIKQLCASENITLIHAHDSHAHSAVILSALLFRNSTPVVLSRRVDFPISKNLFSRYKYNHKSIKRIVAVSQAIKEIMAPDIRAAGVLDVIYDGVDINRFSHPREETLRNEYGISKDTLIIGNVAALADHKDYFTFVDTAAILLRKKLNAKFFIIGQGELKEEIKKYISEKNLEDVVIMTGFRNDIEKILPQLDFLLFTSKTEGLGSTVLDAFAAGVPVIATSAGGVPEVVIDEKTGMLSPVKDAEALAKNVLRLTSDNLLREQLIKNAKAAVKNFSKQVTAASWIKVYMSTDSGLDSGS